jgi:LCP family protein required for cell wall assembly
MSRYERPPLPPRLDPRAGRGVARGAAEYEPPARRTARAGVVVVRAVAAVLSVLLLAGGGWGWYLVRLADSTAGRTDAIPTTGNSDVTGEGHADAELNLLLVGKDSREGLTPEQQAEYSTGDPDGVLNTDSMMLVNIPADGSGASFVSLPRDTYVSIPGYGDARLNSAYARGYTATEGTDAQKDAAGAQLLVQTVSQFTGLQIDHFAEINLLGFINLSTIVGGVEVNLCQATSDSFSGADFPAGVQTITGADALAFVRQRHGLKNSDLDRVVRQQVYLAGLLRNVLSSDVLLDPGTQKAIVEQVAGSITFDRDLDVFDLLAPGLDPGSLTFQTVPGLVPTSIDGADVLQPPAQADAWAFFASLAERAAASEAPPTDAGPALQPADVTVSVLNGSGVTGAAATAATALAGAGFNASSGGNADTSATTTVRHHSGDDAAAALVAAQVPGAAVTVDDSVPAGTVQLVIGGDFNGIGQPVTQQTTTDGGSAGNERTATDTGCIN